MHPDFPNPGGADPDPVEQLLLTLPTASLPAEWRPGILAATVPPPVPPFFTKSLTAFLAAAWGLIAVLHFTTPAPPPAPANLNPPSAYPESPRSEGDFAEPWLAQLQNSATPDQP